MRRAAIERITLQQPNLIPNFIGSWIISNPSICDEMIDYFELNSSKHEAGVTYSGLNTEIKDSIDITIRPKELNSSSQEVFHRYFNNLYDCYKDYVIQ